MEQLLSRLYTILAEDRELGEAAKPLEDIIKIRAVQEFSPSSAVFFVYLLKNIVREELSKEKNREEVLGLQITVALRPINSYIDLLSNLPETDYGLFDLGWILDYQDPEDLFRNESKVVGFDDPAFLDLVEKARAETNQKKRLALYQEADRMLISEAVILPYAYVAQSVFKKPWAHGH